MNLQDLRGQLADHPGQTVRFSVDGGEPIADHFHVTEVGRVEKRFVDCGGVRRSSVACVLQTLVADDTDHRLTTDRLAKIVALADGLDLPAGTPVEVEHQERSVSTDAIDGCEASDGVLTFRLTPKQTACLAEDACGLGSGPGGSLTLTVLNADAGSNTAGEGDCCDITGCR